jgi:phosphatidate phosphatase APP1
MTFLVLTASGYNGLIATLGQAPSPLWVNPGVLSEAQINQLRSNGLALAILPRPVDPSSHAEVQQALRQIQETQQGPIWAEQGMPVPRTDEPQPDAAPLRPAGLPSFDAGTVLKRLRGKANALSRRTLHYIRRFAAFDGPAMIIPYMGFGTPARLTVQGRVLKNQGHGTPDESNSAWANFIELYKQLGSDEVPGARLLARFNGVEQEVLTDSDGYFSVRIAPSQPVKTPGWQTVELELVDPKLRAGNAIRAMAKVLIPPASARFGVISDIDDTVLWSNVTNKLRMLMMLAVSNAHTRKPFKGVTAFYRALHDGISGNESNPIFYVSSSPWHLYTPLVDFFKAQAIPLGPLLLRRLGVRALLGSNRHHLHKLENIERILQTYPDLPFILIGDSGQHDPEIYTEVVERHPDRIRAIYIRNVNPDPGRIEAIDRLIDEVHSTGTQLVLVPDSEFAAMHAAGEGLIEAGVLSAIRSDKRDDERLSNPKV